MKLFLVAILTLLSTSKVFAYTCEEDFSTFVAGQRDLCNSMVHPICTFSVKEQIYTLGLSKYFEVQCRRTCLGGPPNDEWIKSGRFMCVSDSSSAANKLTTEVEEPAKQCGSIVQTENQVVGEVIPIIGSSFSLNYFSNWSEGRKNDYSLTVPLIGSSPRDTITGFDISVESNGVVVDSAYLANTGSNISYSYLWSGLDASSVATLGSRNFKVTVSENRTGMVIPIVTDMNLGGFKARLIGLGGWLPSNYVFYDVQAKKVFRADGSIRSVEAKNYGLSQYLIAEEDGSRAYIFDLQGKHLFTKTGLLGTTIETFNYDGAGRLISIAEPFSRTTTFNRNSSGVLTSITASKGAITTVAVDSNGYLSSITNPNSETYSMTYYGTNGLLHTFQKPGLQLSTFDFDLGGNLTKDTHSGGYFFDLVKNFNPGRTVDISSASTMGRVTKTEGTGGAAGFNRTITRPSLVQESASYSKSPSSRVENWSRGGVSVNVSYGSDSRFFGQAYALQNYSMSDGVGSRTAAVTQSVSLADANDPFSVLAWSKITQFNSSNTTFTTAFNPSSKKFSTSSYLGKTSDYTIDSYERVSSQKIGNLYSVDFAYTNENLTKISQDSRETNLTYNSGTGLLQAVTNSLSQTTGFTYDLSGRLASKVLPDSRVIGYSYDANGNIASITPPGKPTHYFNLNAQELSSSYAPPILSGVAVVNTTYAYNLDKQLTQVTRPDGGVISFNYNSTTGVMTSMVTPEGAFTYYMNYSNELPAIIITPQGLNTQITYAGRKIIGTSNYLSGNLGAYVPSFTAARLTSDNINASSSYGTAVNYSYNDDEDLVTAGSLSLSYNTPNGQLTGTSIGSTGTDVTDSYIYNNFGEVTGYQAKYAGSVIYDLSLTRDGMGRISGKSQSMNSVTDAFAYTFDVTGRLTQTDKNSATVATYVYDDNSNRTGGVIGAQTTVATYDNQDRLNTYNTLSFTYNANGDLTSKTNSTLSQTTNYVYDVFGNLTQVTLPSADVITYEIDGLNRRIGKKLNGTLQKRWVYMDQYRIAAEIDASGAITKRFVYGSKGNIPDYMIYGGENYRIISDHLGSPRLVVKVSDGSVVERMNHDEYGRVTEDTNPGFLPFGFAGGLYDSQTSLIRFGARDFDSEIGRWTSKDPIRFGGGDTNLFGYVANDPINWIDPKGLELSEFEEQKWNELFDVVEYWTYVRPLEKKAEKKRNDELVNFLYPNRTQVKNPLPKPFYPFRGEIKVQCD